jgi:hypothetical protein
MELIRLENPDCTRPILWLRQGQERASLSSGVSAAMIPFLLAADHVAQPQQGHCPDQQAHWQKGP